MVSQSQRNKELRKKRTMRYFIDAASEIVAEEGVSAVTIRSVSARAGYSSASIYKYFQNVNQLIAFSAITCLCDFLEDLCQHITDKETPVETYVKMWFFFAKHAFAQPDLFNAVYVEYGADLFSFIDEYYGIFPEERKTIPDVVQDSLFAKDIHVRNYELLRECSQQGYFTEEEALQLSDFANAAFVGFMDRAKVMPDRFTLDSFLSMIARIILSFNPSLEPLLRQTLQALRG